MSMECRQYMAEIEHLYYCLDWVHCTLAATPWSVIQYVTSLLRRLQAQIRRPFLMQLYQWAKSTRPAELLYLLNQGFNFNI